MPSMINVVYAERLLFDIFVSVLCLSRLVHIHCWHCGTSNISSKFQCLSFVFISNKPTCFMVMWIQREKKETEKLPLNGMTLTQHTSRTNHNIYAHLIVYILCTPTYLCHSIFINIYYENERQSNRIGLSIVDCSNEVTLFGSIQLFSPFSLSLTQSHSLFCSLACLRYAFRLLCTVA